MLTPSGSDFWLTNFVMCAWFISFQFYWFPSLRTRWFQGAYLGLAAGFTGLNLVAKQVEWGWLRGASVLLILAVELGWFVYRRQQRLIPAFLSVSILDYLLSAFVNSVGVTLTTLLTSYRFTVSTWGLTTMLTFSTILFAMISLGLLGTQAPMENFMEAVITRRTQYLLLLFMTLMWAVFILFLSTLRLLHRSTGYLFFLVGITGVVMVGFSVSIYLLLQTHLQQEHARIQAQHQAYHQQYTAELQRQSVLVRKFRHDYQNILLGLGGYLNERDYAGFRQYYIDIRSKWETSNAADLTIDDLHNMPRGVVQYSIYHDYLLAQRLGVNLFVNIPKPLTATVAVGRRVGRVLERSLPATIHAVVALEPAMVNLKITESVELTWVELTFPLPTNVQIIHGNRLVGEGFQLDFSEVLKGLPSAITLQLETKLHWGRLLVTLPMD
ncbi:signal transduction protein [Levilactobacillus zymae]|uniref:signal transduction protein n=1 Tax=Levilactobacillus zymae TaxID=267363 RepID=UPI0028B762A6|nr:signal transduction protein [Levilactobacillus zymae]MDT6981541.1 signal transduction protein [Levilactobacillus zymae]